MKTSMLLIACVLSLLTSVDEGWGQEQPPILGEFLVHIDNTDSGKTVVLEAQGTVWGSGYYGYPITTAYDTLISGTSLTAAFLYIDRYGRGSSPPLDPPAIAHGLYKMYIQEDGPEWHIFIDFRDCHYADSASFGQYYNTADTEIRYSNSLKKFYVREYGTGNLIQLQNSATVGVWQYGRKDLEYAYSERSCFIVPTVVKNVFHLSTQNTASGKFLIVDNDVQNPIASGDTISTWSYQSEHTLRPDSNRYRDIEPPKTHRFHNWLEVSDNILFNYNHIALEPTLIHSNFRLGLSASIQTKVDGIDIPMVTFLKDPWAVKYENNLAIPDTGFVEWNTPLDIGDFQLFGGVHKEKDVVSGQPYYSGRIPLHLGLRSNAWEALSLQDVSTGDMILVDIFNLTPTKLAITTDPDSTHHHPLYSTKGLYFREDSSVITLSFKGHLVADGDLFSNSQRKLCFDNDAYFFGYNSGGSSWLTRKGPDASDPWAVERRIPFTKDAPLSIDANDGHLFATSAVGWYWELRSIDPSTLLTADSIALFVAQGDSVRHAVVAKQKNANKVVVAASKGLAGGGSELKIFVVGTGGAYTPQDSASLTANVGTPVHPTIVCDNSGAFHLAWQEGEWIWYRRFLVDGNGQIDSLDLAPDQVSNCAGILRGELPSITVDKDNRPHIVWETPRRAFFSDAWPEPYASLSGRLIAYRTKMKPFSNPASAASWSVEHLFEIKNKYSLNPVIGNDKASGDKLRIVWQTNEAGGQIHVAVGNTRHSIPPTIQGWRTKTLPDTGATPVISLNTNGGNLGLFTQPTEIQGVSFKKFFSSQDTGRFDFAVLPGINPEELRGGSVRNEHFTIGLALSVYDDSAASTYIPFISVEDTVKLYAPSDLPQVVRTQEIEASHLRFDIRRYVHGFQDGAPFGIFDTESVTWHAEIRNAMNDTLVASLKLGGLEKDSSYVGIDSAFASFARQPVYVALTVEADIDVFPCRNWETIVSAPIGSFLPSTPKRGSIVEALPNGVVLYPNIPNPFNPATTISFSLNEAQPVRLSVHDLLGRELTVLLDDVRNEGFHSIQFHSGDLPSGTYLYRLQAGSVHLTRTMTLVR